MAGTAERRALDLLNAELLVPLPGRNRLMGVMALGPKRSEAAWSRTDLQVLQTVARQTGLALEVSELAHSLAAEAAQRERAEREMEIAREVQERLFPQEMPQLRRRLARRRLPRRSRRGRRLLRRLQSRGWPPRPRHRRRLRQGHLRGAADGQPARFPARRLAQYAAQLRRAHAQGQRPGV